MAGGGPGVVQSSETDRRSGPPAPRARHTIPTTPGSPTPVAATGRHKHPARHTTQDIAWGTLRPGDGVCVRIFEQSGHGLDGCFGPITPRAAQDDGAQAHRVGDARK